MLNWYHKKPLGILAASILFLVMVIGTSLLARNSFVLQQQTKEIEFQSTATSIENKLRQRLLAYEHILRSGVGYLRAADAVTRDQWREFVESLRLQEHYRGIQGIGYTQWLTPEEVPILEQRIRAEGFEDFKVWPEGEREFYTAILFLEPFDWRNQRAFGYDMYSDPARQKAMYQAWKTGEAAATEALTLVQETGPNQQAGFLMYLPVYRQDTDQLRGFVYSPFRMADLMEGIVGRKQQLTVRLEVLDWVGGQAGQVMYASAPASTPVSQLHYETYFQFANHTWLLRFNTLPAFAETTQSREPWVVLLSGLGLSILFTAVFWLFWRTRVHANELTQTNQQLTESVANQQKAERKLEHFFALSNDILLFLTSDMVVRRANPAIYNVLGFDPERMLGKSLSAFVHERDRPLFIAAFNSAVADGSSQSVSTLCPAADGSLRSIEWSITRSTVSASVFADGRDVTERQKAELALQQSEAEFRQIAEGLPHLIWVTDAAGRFEWYNERWYEYTGASPIEFDPDSWEPFFHPEDITEAREKWARSLQTGAPYHTEYRCRRYDGEWRWFLGAALPVRNEQGKIVRWFGTCTDIHDKKTAEQALQATNQELEEFAYVASHDLQEPLRKVSLYTQLLIDEFNQGQLGSIGTYAEMARSGVQRMHLLIKDLLLYSRTIHHFPEQDSQTADLNLALADAISVLEPTLQELSAVIEADPLPVVKADQAQISLVFQNLLANSMKYQSAGQQPQIRIRSERKGSCWNISVTDNGIGFAPEYAEKIFGLFKRLFKDEYPGTGLGLAICKRIVERYHGRVWAASRGPGTGATIAFSLPAAEENAAAPPQNSGDQTLQL